MLILSFKRVIKRVRSIKEKGREVVILVELKFEKSIFFDQWIGFKRVCDWEISYRFIFFCIVGMDFQVDENIKGIGFNNYVDIFFYFMGKVLVECSLQGFLQCFIINFVF